MIKKKELVQPIEFFEPEEFIPIDEWEPTDEEQIFKTRKGIISLPVSEFFGVEQDNAFDSFDMRSKRSYNNPKMRDHCVQYLNYFERFYDKEHELLMIYYKIKYFMDYETKAYTKETFFRDMTRYIMNGSIAWKVWFLTVDNYELNLTYRNKRNPALQYTDRHGKILMKLSILANCMIPLMCHFMYKNGITDSTNFLLEAYDILLHLYPDIDVYNKLYETSISNVLKSEKRNSGLWGIQDIRGINTTTHALNCTTNIILNILPKYLFSGNLVHLNFNSISKNTGFQILDIEFEYNFVPLSSSRRDEDMNSE